MRIKRKINSQGRDPRIREEKQPATETQQSVKKNSQGRDPGTHETKSSANSRQRRESEVALRRLECEATDCSFGDLFAAYEEDEKLKLDKSEFGEK